MRKIEVVIQPCCLDEVMDVLAAAGIETAVAKSVKSFGLRKGHTEWYRGKEYTIDFAPEVKVEVLVLDWQRLDVVETLKAAVNRGDPGNGSIVTFDCAKFDSVSVPGRVEAIS